MDCLASINSTNKTYDLYQECLTLVEAKTEILCPLCQSRGSLSENPPESVG